MLNKTKATLQGRLCHYKNPKPRNNTRVGAGGQRIDHLNFEGADLTQDLVSSLACFRWRRLISPLTAVTMNCAFVSPSSRLLSNSVTTSCGNLALSCCDLLLIEPVAITESPYCRCDSVYGKKTTIKDLKCDSLEGSLKSEGAIHLLKTKPGSALTLTGLLTKPLIEVTVMAEQQHTQTRPKFTWLFLGTPHHTPECSPIVLRCEADTEEAARIAFPCWDLVFAAKIRAEVPCRVAFFDYTSRRGWEFDSAAIQDVIHVDIDTVARDCDIATPSRDIHMNTPQEVRHA